jgi:hypothetical protein
MDEQMATPKAVTPECFNRGSSLNSAGFPLKACGNDGLREIAVEDEGMNSGFDFCGANSPFRFAARNRLRRRQDKIPLQESLAECLM